VKSQDKTQELAEVLASALIAHYRGAQVRPPQLVMRIAAGQIVRDIQVFVDLPSGERIAVFANILREQGRRPGA